MADGLNPEVWCACNRPMTSDMMGICDICRMKQIQADLSSQLRDGLVLPELTPELRSLWDEALARLDTLHKLGASAVDLHAAREYRNDVLTQICDYFLVRWDSLSIEERDGVSMVMSSIPFAREVAKLAFNEAEK